MVNELPARVWFRDYEKDCDDAVRFIPQLYPDEKEAVNQIRDTLAARYYRCSEYFYEQFARDMGKPPLYMDFYKRAVAGKEITIDALALLQALRLWSDESRVFLRGKN